MTQERAPAWALSGIWFGLAAAFGWAVYNVGTQIGREQGFAAADLTLLRYLGGAAVMLPLMVALRKHPLRGMTWARIALLTCVAGPPFAWFFTTGFSLAPLSHAVVISPGMTMIVAMLLSHFVDGHRLSLSRLFGMALLLLGLSCIAADQSGTAAGARSGPFWSGDLCFVASGSLWGIFTWLMSRWRLDPISATGAVALASSAIFVPIYLLIAQPADLTITQWATQFIYQGMLGGSLAIVWYNVAVRGLGTAAGVFPALVPPFAILMAVPMTGSMPNVLQTAGIGAATLGLLVSLNLSKLLRQSRLRDQDHGKVSG